MREAAPRADLWRALGTLAGPPTPEREPLARALELGPLPEPAEYTDLFLLQLHPYASIYLGAEGMLGGEARDRIAGFWRAVGRTPPPEPDHLAVLLGLHGALVEEEAETDRPGTAPSRGGTRTALARHARAALFHEHLAPWLFPYLGKMEEVAGPFYRGWAELLRRALEEEAEVLDAPAELPAHLAEAPPPTGAEAGEASEGDAADGLDGLAGRILTPVRSGLILTRTDLVRASRERGLPLRIGERRFALRNMLQATPDETVAWLREEAAGWVARHGKWEVVGGSAARFWRARAQGTEELLADPRGA